MADFPTLTQGESPSLYGNNFEDTSIKADTDGGYEFRRDRFTRNMRRLLETGFLSLPHDQFEILEAFYEDHRKTEPFTYYDYMRGVTRTVRFDEFKSDYVGIGQNRMWTVKIKMSEV
jgi:hypothetical protein